MSDRVFNFSAGPAVLPESVLARARDDMMGLPGLGMSVMEISHRSAPYQAIHDSAKSNIRKLLNLPDNYQVLFLQGGSRLQFSMIPMNLADSGQTAQYMCTGTWSKKAIDEAKKVPGLNVDVVCDYSDSNFKQVPAGGELSIDSSAAYAYYCSNETIQGVQFPSEPSVGDVPLVCDASSDIFCRPLDMPKYGILYACAQKNAGPAGVTILIIRDDLLERSKDELPGYLNFKTHADNDSMFNTPPTFGIYMVNLIAEWLLNDIGGLDKMVERNRQKSKMLYDVLDASDGFYAGHADAGSRSLMNVTFNLPSDEIQSDFIAGAEEHGLFNLKGHRSVGGIRASIYNALPVTAVEALRDFMKDFYQKRS
ncbi:MAG: 3-phosphoserine/phosphohydroxythreonine transaminase [Planctomycetota bacterium]